MSAGCSSDVCRAGVQSAISGVAGPNHNIGLRWAYPTTGSFLPLCSCLMDLVLWLAVIHLC